MVDELHQPNNDTLKPESGVSHATFELTGANAHLQTLRTFQSDLADTIKTGQGSIVKIAMAEHDKKEREQANINPISKKNLTFIISGIVLIICAVGGIGYIVYLKLPKVVQVTREQPKLATIISTDTQKGLDVTNLIKDNVRDSIGKEYVHAAPGLNTIEQAFLFIQDGQSQHILTTDEFFAAIESGIPAPLLRSLDPTYTIGIHAFDGNGLFLAFKTNAYTIAFAGMLIWERDLFDDMYRIFNIPITGDNASLFSTQFKDRVIKNQDTRTLVDSSGNIVLFYTFIGENKDILIITNKESTLQEILNRLTANNLRR